MRRPDVQARFGDLRVAFEAQLNTTFLDVVIGRKVFYREEGALLVWVLPHFNPTYRQMTVDDLLFNNNANVFVVDSESVAMSEAAGRFLLRCAYRRPVLALDGLSSSWETRLVGWEDLTVDLVQQRLYAFDCEGEERRLLAARHAALMAEREVADADLRQALFDVLTIRSADSDSTTRAVAWSDVKQRFAKRGLCLVGDFDADAHLRNIVCGVLSARQGRPIGYRFEKLIQVAHHLADSFPEGLIPFGLALRATAHNSLLREQDKYGHWARKAAKLRTAYRDGDPAYVLNDALRRVLVFLFPEIADKLLAMG
jgi:hypothetical protein